MVDFILGHWPAIFPTALAAGAGAITYRDAKSAWRPPLRPVVAAAIASWALVISVAAWVIV
jgi:hypothetical protein